MPHSRLRARRKRRRARLAIVAAGFLFLLMILLVGASYLPFLQIREVEVTGTRTLATSTVAAYVERAIAGQYLYLFPKRNIFLYPKPEIAAGLLAEYPELRTADVHAVTFHSIAADVAEREPKALWCQAESCFLMDQGGVAYAPAGEAGGFVSYRGLAAGESLPRQYLEPETFESLFALVDALSQRPEAGPVQSVSVDAQGDAEAMFESGFVLKFALHDAGGDVFERFELALVAEPFVGRSLADFEYLDLRFGDKLYYRAR